MVACRAQGCAKTEGIVEVQGSDHATDFSVACRVARQHDGTVLGMELFDCEESSHQLMPKIIRNYALDCIEPSFKERLGNNPLGVGSYLSQVMNAPYQESDAIGEGLISSLSREDRYQGVRC